MELEKFIAESLESIAKGINEANEKLAPFGACVNPFADSGSAEKAEFRGEMCGIHDVKFDIAVTVSKQSDTEGKISVFSVGNLGGNILNGSEQVSRLVFSLKLAIPQNI